VDPIDQSAMRLHEPSNERERGLGLVSRGLLWPVAYCSTPMQTHQSC